MKNQNRGICIWLGIIAFLLFCVLILFATYIYKFNLISIFIKLFKNYTSFILSFFDTVITALVGIATIFVSIKLAEIQKGQAEIEKRQCQLYTEPHILIDDLTILPAQWETSAQTIKSISCIDYPYYTNTLSNIYLENISIISVSIVNTSEAFARFRFKEAIIKHSDNKVVAKYNRSTIGEHKNHIMLAKGDTKK